MVTFLVLWVVCIGVCVWQAEEKGFARWPLVLCALLLGPLAVLIVLVMTPNPGSPIIRRRRDEIADVVRSMNPGPNDVAAEIERLAALRDRGVLTPTEFDARKALLLGSEVRR